ncbi:hypothetical protein KPL78_19725 [Roseomonas sp. HJA6]|uniref:Alkaline proteinase inhibitor/ Outer membrane lipoprotein Omp19 domain-containing protein n=1 Tax=Roseomonas alba TaxID=2846776 RepID=A0ABS7ACT1_9PROT|nr:hypothetical protein [Neoroseomonas alba]MBW6400098.1 hypothetical protein [Neoroseomonas alba]
MTVRALVLAGCALAALPALAEDSRTMQSARERAAESAPGPWQGNWVLLRDDPRIRTRGGAATLRLHVIHDAGGAVELQWIADRGICEDPNAGPCEWVGGNGTGRAVAAGGGALAVLLRISADPDDPFLLVLERSGEGRATARLVSEKGDIAYRLDAERE